MKQQIEMMEEFHRAFGHPIDRPELITDIKSTQDLTNALNFIKLRNKLHAEECKELDDELWELAITGKITPNLLKEASDLLYVLLGTLVALGVADKFEEAFKRVHESNMSKLGDDGKPVYREDGKVLKGPNYKAPDLGDLV